jgi:hypothetical protein
MSLIINTSGTKDSSFPQAIRREPRGYVSVIVAGPLRCSGARATGFLDHYGLLRTIEQSGRLPLLEQSGSAAPVTVIWRP